MTMTREEAIQILSTRDAHGVLCRYTSGVTEALDMAIEALSAKSVSKEEYEETDGVIEIKKQSTNDVGEIKYIVVCSPNYTRYFYNESMQLPSSEDDWIPCSEKLPKTDDSVLATYSDGEVGIIWDARPKLWGTYMKNSHLIYPIAWMPLPKPYRKDGEE